MRIGHPFFAQIQQCLDIFFHTVLALLGATQASSKIFWSNHVNQHIPCPDWCPPRRHDEILSVWGLTDQHVRYFLLVFFAFLAISHRFEVCENSFVYY